jgi:hypothetical protein
MGMKIKGGGKLAAHLAAIVANVKKSDGVKVGFFENATYPDGTPVAQVAWINENGAIIQVEAHQQTVYRAVDKNGDFKNNGRFVKRNKSNFSSSHHVAAHTVTIPPRPFFRKMINDGSPRWGKELGVALESNGYDTKAAFEEMGSSMKDALTNSIVEFSSPENSKSTVAKKGFNNPLVDTGRMGASTGYKVNE